MELLRMLNRKSENAFELSCKEALEKVVAFLQYQKHEYDRLSAEERKGHIWEAVGVLQRELMQQRLQEMDRKRQVGGPVQGH